jgi:hypothetical protein
MYALPRTQAAAVWEAWHNLDNHDPSPVATVARQTGLPFAKVAAIIGGQDPALLGANEPEPATYEQIEDPPEPVYDQGDEVDDEGGASEYRHDWSTVDRLEQERPQ